MELRKGLKIMAKKAADVGNYINRSTFGRVFRLKGSGHVCDEPYQHSLARAAVASTQPRPPSKASPVLFLV